MVSLKWSKMNSEPGEFFFAKFSLCTVMWQNPQLMKIIREPFSRTGIEGIHFSDNKNESGISVFSSSINRGTQTTSSE